MNSSDSEYLLDLRVKKKPFRERQKMLFKESIQRMADLHPVHSGRLQFLADMADNFNLFWIFYTMAIHFYLEGFRHYSQRTIKELIVHHTVAATITQDGYRINNNVVKYLAELAVVYDNRLGKLFNFREKDQKELPPVENPLESCGNLVEIPTTLFSMGEIDNN